MAVDRTCGVIAGLELPHDLLAQALVHTESAATRLEAIGQDSTALTEALGHLTVGKSHLIRAQTALGYGQLELDAFTTDITTGAHRSVPEGAPEPSLQNLSRLAGGELYVIDRKIGSSPVRLAACSHTPLNGPYVAEALANSKILVFESPGLRSEAERLALAKEYTGLLSSRILASRARGELEAKKGTIPEYLKHFIGSDKAVLLMDVAQTHPQWPVALGFMEELAEFRQALSNLASPEQVRAILRSGLPRCVASMKVREEIMRKQLHALAAVTPGVPIGVVAGAYHYRIIEGLPTLDGEPAEPLEDQFLRNRLHDVQGVLLTMHERKQMIPDELLDREVLTAYLDSFALYDVALKQFAPRNEGEAERLQEDILHRARTNAQKLVAVLSDEKVASCMSAISAAAMTRSSQVMISTVRRIAERLEAFKAN